MKLIVRNGSIAALLLAAAMGYSQDINPSILKNSSDGPGTTVQSQLKKLGLTSTVGANGNYGNQLKGRYFDSTGTMDWTIAYQFTKWNKVHEIGYYTNLTSLDPTITWVLGGSSTGLPTSVKLNISGEFGLAFQTANTALKFGNPEGVFYSNPSLNQNDSNQVAVIKAVGPTVKGSTIITSWEDGPVVTYPQYADYNDLGLLMTNTKTAPKATPEPGVWLGLGLGAFLMRRKLVRKAS